MSTLPSRSRKTKTILDYNGSLDIADNKNVKDDNTVVKKKEPLLTGVETSFLALSVVGATGITTAVNINKDTKTKTKFKNIFIALLASLVSAVMIIFIMRIVFGKKTDKGVVSLVRRK